MGFLPGNAWAGNKKGRPHKNKSIAEVIRSKVGAASLVTSLKELATTGDQAATKLAATRLLLDWGWPKPPSENDERLAAIEERLDAADAAEREREAEAGL